jgi:hypothetical protein
MQMRSSSPFCSLDGLWNAAAAVGIVSLRIDATLTCWHPSGIQFWDSCLGTICSEWRAVIFAPPGFLGATKLAGFSFTPESPVE